MPSTVLFIIATLLLSLNFVRPLGLAISDWLYFGALGFAYLETFVIDRDNAQCWWRNRLLWGAGIILFGALISTMNSPDWVVAVVEICQQLFVMTLFVSLIWILVRRGKITLVIFAFILSGVFTSGVVLGDYLTGSRLGPILSGTPDVQLWGRYAGTLGHPNKLGYFLVLTTLLSIGYLLNIKNSITALFSRLVCCAMIAIQGLGIYLSGSMTAYLGLLTGIVFFALSLKSPSNKATKILRIVVAGTILFIGISLTIHWILTDSFSKLSNNLISQALVRVQTSTAEYRLRIYAQAWDRIVQNPWFGVGYDQISTSGIEQESRYLSFSVHNPLLEIWYTGGLFAFIGWLFIYLWVVWKAIGIKRSGNDLSPLIISIASAALAALLMDQLQDSIYQREKWLVFGLLVSVSWEMIKVRTVKPDQIKVSDNKNLFVVLPLRK
jgi:O-antigen ligase